MPTQLAINAEPNTWHRPEINGRTIAAFQTASVISIHRDSRVVKENRHESGDNQYRALQQNQSADGQELSYSACQETDGNRIRRTETIRYRTVNSRNRAGQQLARDTLEGIGQLSYKGTNAQLQDCQIYGKVQTGRQNVEQEACALSQEACLCQIITSQQQ